MGTTEAVQHFLIIPALIFILIRPHKGKGCSCTLPTLPLDSLLKDVLTVCPALGSDDRDLPARSALDRSRPCWY
jgi:hypothetical protein